MFLPSVTLFVVLWIKLVSCSGAGRDVREARGAQRVRDSAGRRRRQLLRHRERHLRRARHRR